MIPVQVILFELSIVITIVIANRFFFHSYIGNPPAKVSWWKDGIPVEGVNGTSKSGLWGGTVSSLDLKINVTQDMNEVIYTCQSNNEALQRSSHEAITLQVLCKFGHLIQRYKCTDTNHSSTDPPKFVPPPSSTVVGVEGESLQVAMLANANPISIAYTWTKDGLPILASGNGVERIVSEGPILNITKLTRNDAGIYTCEAVNSQGSAMINISVIVECKSKGSHDSQSRMLNFVSISSIDGATIKSISENVIVNPGDEAMLSCTVTGKPLTEDHVRWERLGYDMNAKTTTTFANGTSYLHIKDPQREDVGNFRCVADNRVANPTSRDVLLIVKCKQDGCECSPLLNDRFNTFSNYSCTGNRQVSIESSNWCRRKGSFTLSGSIGSGTEVFVEPERPAVER